MVNSYAPGFGRFSRGAFLALLVLSFSPLVWGQGFGTIVGTITDQSGAVVAGAKVTVTDPATGQNREETTNAQGYYVVPSLKPAPYDVSVAASGFGVYTQKGVVLQADQSATVNAALSLGKTSESVLVTAEPPQVNTTTATMSEVVEQRRVVDLPLERAQRRDTLIGRRRGKSGTGKRCGPGKHENVPRRSDRIDERFATKPGQLSTGWRQ